MQKEIILSKLTEYLELKKVKISKRGMLRMIKCPFCNSEDLKGQIIPNVYKVNCFGCKSENKGSTKYDIFDFARKLDNLEGKSEDEIIQYLKKVLNLDITTNIDEKNTEDALNWYKKNNFNMCAMVHHDKCPVKGSAWSTNDYKDKVDWLNWILNGLNISVITGKRSGITVLDFDVVTEQDLLTLTEEEYKAKKVIPESMKKYMDKAVIQEGAKGFHFIFTYNEEIPKCDIEYEGIHVDIENDGGLIALYPSKVKYDNNDKIYERKIWEYKDLKPVPEELKKLIIEKAGTKENKKYESQIKIDDVEVGKSFEGSIGANEGRNNYLTHMGGIFRKKFGMKDTEMIIQVLNQKHCNPPLIKSELEATVLKSISKYKGIDDDRLIDDIKEYMKEVKEATLTEVAMALVGTNRGEDYKKISLCLTYLNREKFLLRRGKKYEYLEEVEWDYSLLDACNPLPFKVPYFGESAVLEWSDLILVGGKTKLGKTTFAINIAKQIIEQGHKVHYLYSEPGSRFKKISLKLGLKENEMLAHKFCRDPRKIPFKKNSIIIVDWLNITDKAKTDAYFGELIDILAETQSLMFVFQQLKADNEWYAPNMATDYPALGAKLIYTDLTGKYSKLVLYPIREPKIRAKTWEVPLVYDFDSHVLSVVKDNDRKDIKNESRK